MFYDYIASAVGNRKLEDIFEISGSHSGAAEDSNLNYKTTFSRKGILDGYVLFSLYSENVKMINSCGRFYVHGTVHR